MIARFGIFFLFIVLGLYSCRQVNENSNSNKIQVQEAIVKDNIIEVYHRFPSPQEMFAVIDGTDLTFNTDILNKVNKSNDYLDSKSQALNLGVYSADLAYITAFKKYNESTKYFEAIYQLSDNLQISSAFSHDNLKSIQNNITNPDSLKKYADIAMNSLNNYLVANDKEKIFAIIAIGGFIEALYISFDISGSFSSDNIFTNFIVDQKYVLDNISDYSKLFQDDEAVKYSLEIIAPLIEIYNSLEVIPEKTKVSKTSQGKIIIKGGDSFKISEDQYYKLKEVTYSARKLITNN